MMDLLCQGQLRQFNRQWQPGSLPSGVWESSSGMLAPGIKIGSARSISSKIGLVEVEDRFVSVHGPDDAVRDHALGTITDMGWNVARFSAELSYQLTPPDTMKRHEAEAQTARALAALSLLMPPGMSGHRSVTIDAERLPVPVAHALRAGVQACDGLGLGTVCMLGLGESVSIGTVVPILVDPALLSYDGAERLAARSLINYMAAVTAQSAGPYDFHLVVDDKGTSRESVRCLLKTLQDDPRLASGAAGWVSQVALYSGLLMAVAGLVQFGMSDASAGLAEAFSTWRNVVEGMGLAGAMAVYRSRTDQRSKETVFGSTPFRLSVWLSPQSLSPSPRTLHRTQRGSGTRIGAMQTRIEKTG